MDIEIICIELGRNQLSLSNSIRAHLYLLLSPMEYTTKVPTMLKRPVAIGVNLTRL
jgi:hypothetical protein